MTPTVLTVLIVCVVLSLLCCAGGLIVGLLALRRASQGTLAGHAQQQQALQEQKALYDQQQQALQTLQSQQRQERVAENQALQQGINATLSTAAARQAQQQEQFEQRLDMQSKTLYDRVDAMRRETAETLRHLQEQNNQQLDRMRQTVDEKLGETLNTRLNNSFEVIDKRLAQVYETIGELRQINEGVVDLRKVLTNVKTRGTWGEVQLGMLLSQVLTPGQYEQNLATRPGSTERVEYAIVLPGRDEDRPVYLPIDAKFPQEDYQRLCDATDKDAEEAAGKALEARLRDEAKKIHDKYIEAPYTTDFAIMYLPTEGLYAEVIRRPGLTDNLQRQYKIVPAGPTTLLAILSSLQMGFRSLTIEKRSSEIWRLLGAVRTEFGKFGGLLERTHQQLDTVQRTIGQAASKSRTISRKLRDVEELPEAEARALLPEDLLNMDDPADD